MVFYEDWKVVIVNILIWWDDDGVESSDRYFEILMM